MKTHRYKWYDAFLLPWRCAPVWTTLRIFLLLIMKGLPAVQVFATAAFLDGALELSLGKRGGHSLWLPVLALAGIIIASHLGTVAANLLKQLTGNGIRKKFMDYLTVKCASLPYAQIESSETWDLIGRVKNQSDEKVEKGFGSLLNLMGLLVQTGSFLAILFVKVWWSLPLVAAGGGIVVYLALRGGQNQYDAEKNVAGFRRRYQYYGDLMTDRNAAEERNLFRFFPAVQKMWEESYRKTREIERGVVIRYLVRIKLVSSSMAILTFAVAAVLLIPLSAGTLTAGLYISLIQAANGVVDLMSWELSDYISAFVKYQEYVKDVVEFSNLPEVHGVLDSPADAGFRVQEIEFQNVSFSYPGTQRQILKNLNLKIVSGRHYALVGGNGAGKTTVIKLLAGLYPEFEGEILINRKSIRSYPPAELKAMLAVLFQDFARYEIPVGDNIALGDIRSMGTQRQRHEIEKALSLLGLSGRVSRLKSGLDTRLGKLLDGGEDLSGGEWQRLALARAVISPADVLVLDEPTAALDPLSESRLYEEFGKIIQGRTTVFISHRLGSTMLADEIIVLDQGRLVGQGAHKSLMSACPLYRQMYESQQNWYAENV